MARPILHYLYVTNNPMLGVDPSGLWEEQGHFYTVYIVARAAGLSHKEASVLAYYARLPDEDDAFNATTAGFDRAKNMFKMNAHKKDIQEVLHSLHGGDAIKRRNCLKKLLMEGNLKPWQKGLVIHAFGDAYAHTYVEDGKIKAFGGVLGHGIVPTALAEGYTTPFGIWIPGTNFWGLTNVFGSHPDSIGNHNKTYSNYIRALYDTVKTETGDPSKLEALDSLADTFTRNRASVKEEVAALRDLAIKRGYTSSYAPENSDSERYLPFERFHSGQITNKEIKDVIKIIKKACEDPQQACDPTPHKGFDYRPSNCPSCNT